MTITMQQFIRDRKETLSLEIVSQTSYQLPNTGAYGQKFWRTDSLLALTYQGRRIECAYHTPAHHTITLYDILTSLQLDADVVNYGKECPFEWAYALGYGQGQDENIAATFQEAQRVWNACWETVEQLHTLFPDEQEFLLFLYAIDDKDDAENAENV